MGELLEEKIGDVLVLREAGGKKEMEAVSFLDFLFDLAEIFS